MSERENRRSFLKKTVAATQAAGVLGLTTPLLQGCGGSSSPSSSSGTPTVTANSSGVATLEFSEFPNLRSNNGTYKVNLKNGSTTTVAYVTRVSTGMAKTVSVLCTHQGCTVGGWDGSRYLCPCHGSSYDSSGSVLTGPAVTSLTSFTSTVTSSGIEVVLV